MLGGVDYTKVSSQMDFHGFGPLRGSRGVLKAEGEGVGGLCSLFHLCLHPEPLSGFALPETTAQSLL